VADPGAPATKHLKEAETIAIMNRRRNDGFFLTDDHDAKALATYHNIPVVSIWDLLRMAYRTNKTTAPTLAGYLKATHPASPTNTPSKMAKPIAFQMLKPRFRSHSRASPPPTLSATVARRHICSNKASVALQRAIHKSPNLARSYVSWQRRKPMLTCANVSAPGKAF
jgi:hypothetical protein